MIKMFEQYNEYNKIRDWLDSMGIVSYTINNDFSVDVKGDVNLSKKWLNEIPVQFGKVEGYFTCAYNELTSLKGCPQYVEESFYCNDNGLTNLEFCPKIVKRNFDCSYNELTTLEKCPEFVEDSFYCNDNPLKSLAGCPQHVGYNFICFNTILTNLEHAPKYIGGSLECAVDTLPPEILKLGVKVNDLVVYQDDYGVWNSDGTLNKGRFDLFLRDLESDKLK